MIERVTVTRVPFTRHARQMTRKTVAVAVNESRKLLNQRAIDAGISRQIALVEQADVQFDVAVMQFRAFGGRAHRMADAQAGIPQLLEESGNGIFEARSSFVVREQQQQIHVGVRKKLAPPVTAYRQ